MMKTIERVKLPAFVFITLILLLSGNPVSADLAYLDFTTTDGLVFNGDAVPVGDVIRLTPAVTSQVGSMWYETKQSVEEGFSTQFDFQITERSPATYGNGADGFAFVVQNSGLNALGGGGGNMGYGDDGGGHPGIANSIAVEFDTFNNDVDQLTDAPPPHISVQTRGASENNYKHEFSLGWTTSIGSIDDGAIHTARINYVPGELAVFLDPSPRMPVPTLRVPIDLSSLLDLDDGTVWVGFTAGTGGSYENHDILSWQFIEVPEPATLLLLGLGAVMVRRNKRSI